MCAKENQRVMLTKRLIKESLTRLLADGSIYKVSVRTLCDNAGINRSTFYKYYGSQYDVLAEMEADLLGRIQSTLNEMEGGAVNTADPIRAICAYIEQNVDTVQLLLINNVDPAFPEKLLSLPQIQKTLGERLADHFDSESQPYVFTFLINGCYHLIREWIGKRQRNPPEEIAQLIQELFDKLCG